MYLSLLDLCVIAFYGQALLNFDGRVTAGKTGCRFDYVIMMGVVGIAFVLLSNKK
jgi:hypothetical protein